MTLSFVAGSHPRRFACRAVQLIGTLGFLGECGSNNSGSGDLLLASLEECNGRAEGRRDDNLALEIGCTTSLRCHENRQWSFLATTDQRHQWKLNSPSTSQLMYRQRKVPVLQGTHSRLETSSARNLSQDEGRRTYLSSQLAQEFLHGVQRSRESLGRPLVSSSSGRPGSGEMQGGQRDHCAVGHGRSIGACLASPWRPLLSTTHTLSSRSSSHARRVCTSSTEGRGSELAGQRGYRLQQGRMSMYKKSNCRITPPRTNNSEGRRQRSRQRKEERPWDEEGRLRRHPSGCTLLDAKSRVVQPDLGSRSGKAIVSFAIATQTAEALQLGLKVTSAVHKKNESMEDCSPLHLLAELAP